MHTHIHINFQNNRFLCGFERYLILIVPPHILSPTLFSHLLIQLAIPFPPSIFRFILPMYYLFFLP